MTIDTAVYVVPAPIGFCASGTGVDAYLAAQRQMGPSMTPDVAMLPCGAQNIGFDFYAVRAIANATATTREAYLAELRRTMPEAQSRPSLVTGDSLAKRMSEVFDTEVKVDAGIRPVGVDDSCGYVAGKVGIAVSGKRSEVTMVGCATVIGGRITYVFRYRPGTDTGAAVAAMPEVKALALAIRPAK